MVTFGSHVGNHQFQPFLSGVYAGVIFHGFQQLHPSCGLRPSAGPGHHPTPRFGRSLGNELWKAGQKELAPESLGCTVMIALESEDSKWEVTRGRTQTKLVNLDPTTAPPSIYLNRV